jgi:hypothetical protein
VILDAPPLSNAETKAMVGGNLVASVNPPALERPPEDR